MEKQTRRELPERRRETDVRLNRRSFLKTAGLAAASAGTLSVLPGCSGMDQTSRAESKRPNIIVIISDDMGYADIGCHGCQDIATPNIDSIARNGVRFTNGYVSCPVCSPTRAGLATGRYQQRFGHEYNTGPPPGGLREQVGLPLTEVTIANVLKSAGYVTGAVGKWHLGMVAHFHPFKRGYDEFFGFLHGGHSYIDPGLGTFNPILRGTEPVDEKEYLTDAFSREAVAFIEHHHNVPFFLYLAYNAVHTPMQGPQRYKNSFKHITNSKRRVYAGMLTAMDEGIGKVLAKLRELGIEEDTLLFFVNDNGGPTANASDNRPLRATKGTMYEGGIRVPFMIQWPRRLKGGQVYEHPVIALDILPTAAVAAGGKLPADRKIDGINLLPYLTDNKKRAPHKILFWRSGQNHAVRKGNWKLVRMGSETGLFDLASDIGESRDLKGQRPDFLRKMEEAFERWNSQMIEPVWTRQRRERKTTKEKKKTPEPIGGNSTGVYQGQTRLRRA
ncbi:MAG: sulfatase-like hydrolase/transferase [Planctomycetota bacterium]